MFHQNTIPMKVKLTRIDISKKQTLKQMLKAYQKELLGRESGEYKYLNSYWQNPNSYPFFIVVNGEIIGFVLINSYTVYLNKAKSISEFYIKPKFRKQGLGKQAAKLALNKFKGECEIRVLKDNNLALDFWKKIATELVGDKLQEVTINNKLWSGRILVFDNS